MKNWLFSKLLPYAGKKLDGKKTFFGGAGKVLSGIATMLVGVVGILGNMFPDQGLPNMTYLEASGAISAGIVVASDGLQGIGLGHKLEKMGGTDGTTREVEGS